MTIIQRIIQFLYTIFTQPIRIGEITISVSLIITVIISLVERKQELVERQQLLREMGVLGEEFETLYIACLRKS